MKRAIQKKPTIHPTTLDDYATIENMWRYYVYDMGRYCGLLKGWECPINLSFTPDDLTHYFVDPSKKVFLIKIEEQLAGFVFLNKISASPIVEWKICEFFIVARFQGMGVGQHVAKEIFSRYPGKWSVAAILENLSAIKFWRKIINEISCDQFTEVFKTTEELATREKPDPHAMIIFNFNVTHRIKYNRKRQSE